MILINLLDVAGPGVFLLLPIGIGLVVVLFLLIAVIESAALQIVRWDSFKRCLRASLVMNLVTTLLGFGLVYLMTRWGYLGLLIAWLLSVLIEALILGVIKRGAWLLNFKASTVANIVSYLILLVPMYYFASR